jgi:hypothetical protein
MDPATTRGIVERLKERKLISVLGDKNDDRRVIADLTENGRQLLAKVIPSALAISEQTMGTLNSAERVALLYLLNKISGSQAAATKTYAEARRAGGPKKSCRDRSSLRATRSSEDVMLIVRASLPFALRPELPTRLRAAR